MNLILTIAGLLFMAVPVFLIFKVTGRSNEENLAVTSLAALPSFLLFGNIEIAKLLMFTVLCFLVGVRGLCIMKEKKAETAVYGTLSMLLLLVFVYLFGFQLQHVTSFRWSL